MAYGKEIRGEGAEGLTLRKHYDVFEECEGCESILGMLRARNMISLWEHQLIMAETTQIGKNGYVMSS